jgi:hypothetical protein
MSLLSIAQWVQATDFFTALRISARAYPIVMSLHLVGIAMFGGMILITNLRLLGWIMKNRPIADVIDQLRVLKWIGFALVATCGILMLGSKAEEYYYNSFFWMKISCLSLIAVHGLIFRRSVYRNAAALDRASRIPGHAKLAAALSLLLWISVVIAGRGIGYIEPPLEKLHAYLNASYLKTVLSNSASR